MADQDRQIQDWQIRVATPADTETITEFNAALAMETEKKTLDPRILQAGVAAALEDPGKARYFVAEFHNEIIGQLMHTWEWSDWRNGYFWWLQSVYVHQKFRQQGIFRSLYNHVLQLAKSDPEVVGIRLYVESENQRAQSAYENLGMVNPRYEVREITW